MKKYPLKLYVCGQTAKTRAAIANLRAICRQYFDDQYELKEATSSDGEDVFFGWQQGVADDETKKKAVDIIGDIVNKVNGVMTLLSDAQEANIDLKLGMAIDRWNAYVVSLKEEHEELKSVLNGLDLKRLEYRERIKEIVRQREEKQTELMLLLPVMFQFRMPLKMCLF